MDHTYLYIDLDEGTISESNKPPTSEETLAIIEGSLLVLRVPDPIRAEILTPIDDSDVDSWGYIEPEGN